MTDSRGLKLLLNEAGVVSKYIDKTWDDCSISCEGIDDIRKYIKKFRQYSEKGIGLYVYGPPRCGKTFVVNLVLKSIAIENPIGIKYFDFETYCYTQAEGFVSGFANEVKSINYHIATSRRLVCFDTIPGPTSKEVHFKNLEQVLRIRTDNGLPTILSSSLSPTDLKKVISPGFTELLREYLVPIALPELKQKITARL